MPRRQRAAGAARLTGRREPAQALREAMEVAGGAVVLGPPGIGKTALVREACAQSPDVYLVNLRGSAANGNVPYEALAWLLSELPADVTGHPMMVVRGLRDLLAGAAQGRRIVMVLDNADEIDDLSLLVAAQLCRQQVLTLLVTATDLLGCGGEFLRLWSEGILRRIDLGPLNLAETTELISRTAGGAVSSLAVRNLWLQARGNPLLTTLLCRDQIRAGSLFQRGGVWVWAGPVSYTGELAERVEAEVRRLDPEQRRVMELLALGGELRLAVLFELADPAAVEELEEKGELTIGTGREPAAALKSALFAGVVAQLVPPGKSQALLDEVRTKVAPERMTPRGAGALGAWHLACGEEPDPELALRAAAWAAHTGRHDLVLRIVDAVAHEHRTPELALEQVRALRRTGKYQRARRILDRTGDADACAPATQVLLLLERAFLHRRLAAEPGTPESYLASAQVLLDSARRAEGNGAADALSTAAIDLVLARAETAMAAGRPDAFPEAVAGLLEDPSVAADARLRAGVVLAQAHAHRGDFSAALSLAAACASSELGAASASAREDAFTNLLLVHLLAGNLHAGLRLGEKAAEEEALFAVGLRPRTGAELSAGLVHARAGRADAGLKNLLPAVAQLEAADPEGLLPLANAAVAYLHTLRDEPAAAAEYLGKPVPSGMPFAIRQETRFFRSLAAGGRLPQAQFARALFLAAEEAAAIGAGADLLRCLGGAALAGDARVVDRLAGASARADGEPARLYSHLAAGLAADSGRELLHAAETALGLGNHRLGHEAAKAAHAAAQRHHDRALQRAARVVENECFRMLSETNSVEHGMFLLSEFERSLVLQAAAGNSSTALGRAFHLSPRTVDWHLGRIFAKLHVSGRAELRTLLTWTADHEHPLGAGT